MGKIKAFSLGCALWASIMALDGCNYGERVQDPPESNPRVGTTDLSGASEFDRELIAAKSGDPARREAAIASILDKYGVSHPPVARFSDKTSTEPAAAKAANASSFYPVRRDFTAGNDIHTYRSSVTVGKSSHLRIGAFAGADNVDPFLVAYYVDDNPVFSGAYKVRVVGFNDDLASDNRNAVVEWTNTTGNSKVVEFVAFAYSTATRGKGIISITVDGTTTGLLNREIGGLHQYGAAPVSNVPSNCQPSQTWVTETPLFGGGYRAAALVIDTQAMRGGYIRDIPSLGPQTLVFPWTLHNSYPSFALLFEAYSGVLPSNWSETPSQYEYRQVDHYSCVN